MRLMRILFDLLTALAVLLLFLPNLWVMLAHDSDPRRRFLGCFFVLHEDRHVLFIRTPGDSEHMMDYGSIRPVLIGVIVAWITTLTAKWIKTSAARWAAAARARAHLCPSCGYDIRATPVRCPECGTLRE